ncbi:uncharacterized protein TNCT_639681 [Trichonephila clavata]|uniref:Uncharacterized protein n=1 Tax=Trichonephila clavata TaxID=2740835 RepID=A0A8X6FQS6_TRICU|nr:uncharacterized protein TNCT_639681 [Trichonephila clavata]
MLYSQLTPRNRIPRENHHFNLLHGYEPRLPREFHIASFINDMPREDQLDLLMLARAEAANSVHETHLSNKRRFDLHRRSHSFQKGDLVLYNWPKQGDHKLSPILKGPFVIVRPVGAVCYEIKSTTPGNKVLKVVHVQHLRLYFKRESPTIEEDDSSEEESESTVEMKDPADDLQGVPNVTEL